MEELLEGRPCGLPTISNLEHVDHQDAEFEPVRVPSLVRVGACAARVPQVVGHEARQGRIGGDSDGRAYVVGDAQRRKSGRYDANRARVQSGGEGAQQVITATGVAQNRASDDIGQHGERPGPIREPRCLGDEHVLMIGIQGGHQGDGDAGEGTVDHKRG